MSRFRLIGRHMDGSSVAAYEVIDIKNNARKTISREQMVFLVGKGDVEGVSGRLYQDKVIIEAEDGYKNISELPVRNVNNGEFRNVPSGNRRVEVSFDTGALVGRVIEDGRFVIKTGTGIDILDREQLAIAIKGNRIINARLQEFVKDGRKQTIIRMSDGSALSSLKKFSASQLS